MILLIGCGSPLRGDDAIGGRLVTAAARACGRGDVQAISVHQLTPELAEVIGKAQVVIFVDARVGGSPAAVVEETIQPQAGGAFTHHVTPAALLGAAGELYDAHPTGILFSVAGDTFDYADQLSPTLEAALPDLTQRLIQTLERASACASWIAAEMRSV